MLGERYVDLGETFITENAIFRHKYKCKKYQNEFNQII